LSRVVADETSRRHAGDVPWTSGHIFGLQGFSSVVRITRRIVVLQPQSVRALRRVRAQKVCYQI